MFYFIALKIEVGGNLCRQEIARTKKIMISTYEINKTTEKQKGAFMQSRNWIEWAKRAGIRAGKTVAQAAIAGIGTAMSMGQVDWKYVVSSSILAGILSILMSVVGLPELKEKK